jgi:hypothetical protein
MRLVGYIVPNEATPKTRRAGLIKLVMSVAAMVALTMLVQKANRDYHHHRNTHDDHSEFWSSEDESDISDYNDIWNESA